MKKKSVMIVGLILTGCLLLPFSFLHASTVDTQHEDVEYTGEDTPDTIQVKEATAGTASSYAEPAHGAKAGGHVEKPIMSHAADTELSSKHGSTEHATEAHRKSSIKAEHRSEKLHKESTRQSHIEASTGHGQVRDRETGFSTGAWMALIAGILALSALLLYAIKGVNAMKNIKLGTKIIGMVAILLILMAISSVFGILKMGVIGDEIKGITEQDLPLTKTITEITTNQLEQAIWFERALRYGETIQKNQSAKAAFKTAEEEFHRLNKLVNEELKEGEKIAEHARDNAKTAHERKEFEEIDEHLKFIEKKHAGYGDYVLEVFALLHKGKLHEAEEVAEEVEKKEEELDHELEQFLKKVEKFTEDAAVKAEHDENSALMLMSIISVFATVFGLVMAIFTTRSITKPLNRAINELSDGSEQVASASGQVSSSSQQLAEGASEQAASLEETSSSLEEMASMTKQNADNAQQADMLMNETKQTVGKANESMKAMGQSMGEISRSGEEIGKIIKSIDEIAFQTNLLALNAAVEAARAGEHGLGFAVVADEVRNLAQRSADAAKNTADLIEEMVKKIKEGSTLVTTTDEAFQEVVNSSAKVAELVGEISAASQEQTSGIDQINKAVAEMDKVVQVNAANAEESASASEELNAQAENMKTVVSSLVALVGGASNGAGNGAGKAAAKHPPVHAHAPAHEQHTLHHAPKKEKESNNKKKTHIPKVQNAGDGKKAKEAIPMGDEDFKDF